MIVAKTMIVGGKRLVPGDEYPGPVHRSLVRSGYVSPSVWVAARNLHIDGVHYVMGEVVESPKKSMIKMGWVIAGDCDPCASDDELIRQLEEERARNLALREKKSKKKK